MPIRDQVARHSSYEETLDFIPTPPYTVRVLFNEVIDIGDPSTMTAWEPASGIGHMGRVLKEMRFKEILETDVERRFGVPEKLFDFTKNDPENRTADVIVTNPPYAKMPEFISNGIYRSRQYLALLTRIQVLEGQRRYSDVFSNTPPTTVAVFSDRIPFKQNVVVRKAPKMFTHCWVVWDRGMMRRTKGDYETRLTWIRPDAQRAYEKDEDYE